MLLLSLTKVPLAFELFLKKCQFYCDPKDKYTKPHPLSTRCTLLQRTLKEDNLDGLAYEKTHAQSESLNGEIPRNLLPKLVVHK